MLTEPLLIVISHYQITVSLPHSSYLALTWLLFGAPFYNLAHLRPSFCKQLWSPIVVWIRSGRGAGNQSDNLETHPFSLPVLLLGDRILYDFRPLCSLSILIYSFSRFVQKRPKWLKKSIGASVKERKRESASAFCERESLASKLWMGSFIPVIVLTSKERFQATFTEANRLALLRPRLLRYMGCFLRLICRIGHFMIPLSFSSLALRPIR